MQKNILEYLEATAVRVPEKLAFSTGKESMSFGEVYDQARAIGTKLHRMGAYGESVLVLMDKHPRTVTAFWGIIYAGCYYACLDEKMPLARMEAIIESLCPGIIITDKRNQKTAEALGIESVLLYDDICGCDIDHFALADIRRRQCDVDPIYVVFT